MNQTQLEATLADLPLGGIRYFDSVGSTNDEAAHWAARGAPDFALVVADEQTAGRGRAGRRWYTPRGSGLAFSIVVHPSLEDSGSVSRMTALGALAVCDALKNPYHLPAKIKWPNDVLVEGNKVAGVLAETQWIGEQLGTLILGIGINVAPASIEDALVHEPVLHFPSTCIESVLGHSLDRIELLYNVLAGILRWRSRLNAPDFLQAWEANLAYRNEWVQVIPTANTGEFLQIDGKAPSPDQDGRVIGLSNDGSLKLRTRTGEIVNLQLGELRLRPMKPTAAEEESYVR
jgi:BirA family biotin operon repressor/biotin-[acetyl-CoA-carboxylase] ligase